MFMKKYSVLIIIILLALMSGSGCYTVLRHAGDEQGSVDYGDNYSEDYGYSQYYYPSYWTLTPRWGRYYAVPWWWDYGYYHDNEPIYYEDDGSPRSSGGEKATPGSRFHEVTPGGAPAIIRGPSSSGTSAPASPNTATKQKTEQKDSGAKATETRTKDNKDDSKNSKPTRQGRKK
jgi:uncharacterized protein YceK